MLTENPIGTSCRHLYEAFQVTIFSKLASHSKENISEALMMYDFPKGWTPYDLQTSEKLIVLERMG